MSNNYTVGPRVITRIILAMLFAVSGLASCGGGGSTTTTASNAAVISNTPTITLSAASTSIAYNTSTTISWTSTNSTSCSSSGSGGTGTTGSFTTPQLTTTTNYSVTCTGAGGSASKSVTITVASSNAPSETVSADSYFVANNGSTTIRWSSTNTSSCSSSPSGASGTSGSFNTGALNATTTYIVTCTGTGGSVSKSVTINVGSSNTSASNVQSAITSVQAAWSATPLPSTGTTHYFCDCQTGASGNCVAGNDANAGTSASAPKQSIAALKAMLPLANGDTAAFCKGGYWTTTSNIAPNVTTCTAGTTCVDFRDYASPNFTSSAKPTIYMGSGGQQLWSVTSGRGGFRVFNMHFSSNNSGVSYGMSIEGNAHDVWFANNTVDGFPAVMYNNSNSGSGHNNHIYFEGNTLDNNRTFGYLGSSDNSTLSYNYMTRTGSDNGYDHAIYLQSNGTGSAITNFEIKSNYIEAGYLPADGICYGAVIIGHPGVDYLTVSNNYIYVDPARINRACYGISFDNGTSNGAPVFMRHTVIGGNTIINTGDTGINVSSCPGCQIVNNTIILDWSTTIRFTGIQVGTFPARAQDDVDTNTTTANNTIYFGPNMVSVSGSRGIWVNTEGTGHIIANNAVYNSAGVSACLDLPLSKAAYAFIDNNDCYNGSYYEWETRSSLAAWQSATGFDTHSILSGPQFTNPTNPTYNFVPQAGSPLKGAGNATYVPTTDALGVTRPNPPAIGAYE